MLDFLHIAGTFIFIIVVLFCFFFTNDCKFVFYMWVIYCPYNMALLSGLCSPRIHVDMLCIDT